MSKKKQDFATLQELVDFISDRSEYINVPGFDKKIKIQRLSLEEMISIQSEEGNRDDLMLKIALGLNEKQVKKLKESGDGIKYTSLLKAIGEAYTITDSDVKK